MTIRRIETLSDHELKLLARDQADAGEHCVHGFEPGSAQAELFERAHRERLEELQKVGA